MHSATFFCVRAEAAEERWCAVFCCGGFFWWALVWGCFFQIWHHLHLVTGVSSRPAGGGCGHLFSQHVSELGQHCSHRARAHSLTPTHLRAQMHLCACIWATLFRQKKFLVGVRQTVATWLLCMGTSMQDFVLSSLHICSAAAAVGVTGHW